MPFIVFAFQLLIEIPNNKGIREQSGIVDRVLEFKRSSGRGGAARYYLLFTLNGDDKLYGQYYEYAISVYYKPIFREIKIEQGDFIAFYIDGNEVNPYFENSKFSIALKEYFKKWEPNKEVEQKDIQLIKTTGIVQNGKVKVSYKHRNYLTFRANSLRFIALMWLLFNISLFVSIYITEKK